MNPKPLALSTIFTVPTTTCLLRFPDLHLREVFLRVLAVPPVPRRFAFRQELSLAIQQLRCLEGHAAGVENRSQLRHAWQQVRRTDRAAPAVWVASLRAFAMASV